MKLKEAQNQLMIYIIEKRYAEVATNGQNQLVAWEAVELWKEEMSEEMMPFSIIQRIEDPVTVETAFLDDQNGKEHLLCLVNHPTNNGFLGWLVDVEKGTVRITLHLLSKGQIEVV